MKIHIELEVAPSEVAMATELLAVLRTLTDHVSIRSQPSAPGPAPVAPAAASPVPAPPVVPAAQPPAAPAPPGGAPAPPASQRQQALLHIIQQSEYQPDQQALAAQLEAILNNPEPGVEPQLVFEDFMRTWIGIALDATLPDQQRSAVPFVTLFMHLSQPLKERIRDYLVPQIIKHLTQKRPIEAPRSDFYMQAEVFAALVSIDMVGIQGAIKTMSTLVMKPHNRAAAVTVLGKTVELCAYMVQEKVDAPTIARMRETLAGITDPDLMYDVTYIQDSLGWGAGGAGQPQPQ